MQICDKGRGGAALINKPIEEALPEANFPEMFPLSSPQAQPFSMAKRSLLAKNASTTDLTQYINPVLINRRRSSLFCNAVDPALKRLRQREAYKTAMCQAWLEGRTCVYGDQCNFAHGEDELQPLPANRANPKHKTRICENYTTTGICPFGNRCFFIHPKTDEELDTLLRYNEGDALLIQQPSMARPTQGGAVRRIDAKLRQFRKTDSCGTFNLPFHVHNEQQQQRQHWHSQSATTPTIAADDKNYEQLPPLSSAVRMLTGKSLISMKPNVTAASMMPLIHSSSVTDLNLNAADKKIENAERELDKRLAEMRLTMRKMSQQKSFSSSDVCTNRGPTQNAIPIGEKQKEAEKESPGPHTPPLPGLSAFSFPGFFEQDRRHPLDCWSNASSLASVWSPSATDVATARTVPAEERHHARQQQAVPTFCFFEAAAANSQMGGGIERGGQLLRAGKRSPDFEGILMGRRSSHIPLLEENSEMLLNVLESTGMQKGRNKSAEYLSGRCVSGRGGGNGVGDDNQENAKTNDQRVTDLWQSGKRSTNELDEENRSQPKLGADHGDQLGCVNSSVDDHGTTGGGDCGCCDRAEKGQQQKQHKKDDGDIDDQWDEIGRQSCGSTSKLLNDLQTGQGMAANGGDGADKAAAPKNGHNANNGSGGGGGGAHSNAQQNGLNCWTKRMDNSSQQQPICPPRGFDRIGPSNLDKMMHNIWSSSSPNLGNKQREDPSVTHQLWTPFGMQRVEIPSQIDLRGNFYDSSLNLSEQRDRIDTLTNANQRDEKDEDDELANLYSKIHLMHDEHGGPAGEKQNQHSAVAGEDDALNEFTNPTWAQMVRRKSYLRQKSHSSPAINRNCPAAQAAGGNL